MPIPKKPTKSIVNSSTHMKGCGICGHPIQPTTRDFAIGRRAEVWLCTNPRCGQIVISDIVSLCRRQHSVRSPYIEVCDAIVSIDRILREEAAI